MAIFAVTGTHKLLGEAQRYYVHRIVRRAVLRRSEHNTLISGMAWGVDTEAVLAVWGSLPFENLVCVVPGTAQHNWGLVERAAAAGAQIVKAPTLHTAAETYLNRDDVIVSLMTALGILLSFPNQPTFYRSGTWATINRAHKAGRRVRIYSLDKA